MATFQINYTLNEDYDFILKNCITIVLILKELKNTEYLDQCPLVHDLQNSTWQSFLSALISL